VSEELGSVAGKATKATVGAAKLFSKTKLGRTMLHGRVQKDENGNIKTDENGNPIRTGGLDAILHGKNDTSAKTKVKKNEAGEMLDADGNVTTDASKAARVNVTDEDGNTIYNNKRTGGGVVGLVAGAPGRIKNGIRNAYLKHAEAKNEDRAAHADAKARELEKGSKQLAGVDILRNKKDLGVTKKAFKAWKKGDDKKVNDILSDHFGDLTQDAIKAFKNSFKDSKNDAFGYSTFNKKSIARSLSDSSFALGEKSKTYQDKAYNLLGKSVKAGDRLDYVNSDAYRRTQEHNKKAMKGERADNALSGAFKIAGDVLKSDKGIAAFTDKSGIAPKADHAKATAESTKALVEAQKKAADVNKQVLAELKKLNKKK